MKASLPIKASDNYESKLKYLDHKNQHILCAFNVTSDCSSCSSLVKLPLAFNNLELSICSCLINNWTVTQRLKTDSRQTAFCPETGTLAFPEMLGELLIYKR